MKALLAASDEEAKKMYGSVQRRKYKGLKVYISEQKESK